MNIENVSFMKDPFQSMKRQAVDRNSIFENHTSDKRLIFGLSELSSKKRKQSNEKNG